MRWRRSPCSAPEEHRSRLARRRMLLILGASMLVAAVGAVLHYRAHLWWWLAGRKGVRAIPTHPMAKMPPPEGWLDCRFGPLEFTLPPELARKMQLKAEGGTVMLVFSDPSRSLAILIPTEPTDPARMSACLQGDLALPAKGRGLSLTRLRLACFQTSSDDFRWSMTPGEVRWHAWCMRTRFLLALGAGSRAEYLLRDDLEGILHVDSKETCMWFDWQSSDDRFGASVVFRDRSGRIDPTWVRAVCQSLRFSEGQLPLPMPPDQRRLPALFEVERGDAHDRRSGEYSESNLR